MPADPALPLALAGPDPFLIPRPAVVSFSGGRTSGYMLWRILQAYGGVLPDDIVVCFTNTGREMPATLDFVRDCGAAWGVRIRWMEYRAGASYAEVSHNSASRDGEPFAALLAAKPMLPNPVTRFCTIELKLRTTKRFIVAEYGWDHWNNCIGLRADEPDRVRRALGPQRDRWTNLCPLAKGGVTVGDVGAFWSAQSFDLRTLHRFEGNCDGCFLKKREAIEYMFMNYPTRMAWWPRMEAIPHGIGAGGTFRADREDYATMARTVRDQGRLDLTAAELFEPCGVECAV